TSPRAVRQLAKLGARGAPAGWALAAPAAARTTLAIREEPSRTSAGGDRLAVREVHVDHVVLLARLVVHRARELDLDLHEPAAARLDRADHVDRAGEEAGVERVSQHGAAEVGARQLEQQDAALGLAHAPVHRAV